MLTYVCGCRILIKLDASGDKQVLSELAPMQRVKKCLTKFNKLGKLNKCFAVGRQPFGKRP